MAHRGAVNKQQARKRSGMDLTTSMLPDKLIAACNQCAPGSGDVSMSSRTVDLQVGSTPARAASANLFWV